MELCHLELELGGHNNEVAALQSDRYTEVPLCKDAPEIPL